MEDIQEKIIEESSIKVSNVLKKPRGFTHKNAREMVEKAKKSPKHGKHGRRKQTILKEEAFKAIQEKIIERSMKLVDTQTLLAHGTIKVFKIVTRTIGSGKNAKRIRERPVLVENNEEIESAIGYYYGDEEDCNIDDEYYFITTKDPDNRAIKDQLDRVFGPATQKVDITSEGLSLKDLYNASVQNKK